MAAIPGHRGASSAARRSAGTASPARAAEARAWPSTWCARGDAGWRSARRAAAAAPPPSDRARIADSTSFLNAAVESSQSALVGGAPSAGRGGFRPPTFLLLRPIRGVRVRGQCVAAGRALGAVPPTAQITTRDGGEKQRSRHDSRV